LDINNINVFVIERKGNKIEDEIIYNEGQFIRIKLIEFNNKIYWIKKINGRIKKFKEVGESGSSVCMD
jgi:hypothetical protein